MLRDSIVLRKPGFIHRTMAIYLTVIVACTVLIQLPELREMAASRIVLFGLWIIALFACALVGKVRRSRTFAVLMMCVLVFDCYSVLLDAIKDSGYTTSPLFYNINLTCLFLVIGYLASTVVDPSVMLRVCKTYALAVLALTPYFVVNYFGIQRIFASKNSLGPIMVYAAIIFAVLFPSRSRLGAFLKWLAVIWLVACVFMSINRASMVSILILALYYTFVCLPTLKKRLIALLILVVLIGGCLSNAAIFEALQFVTKANLASDNMDDFSAGRMGILDDIKKPLSESPIVGVGQLYVENFHLSVLLQVGLLGCAPVFVLYFYPIWFFALDRARVHADVLARVIALMAVHGAVISCFEEQAPFGQGSAYFILWLLIGYYIGYLACCRTSPPSVAVAARGAVR